MNETQIDNHKTLANAMELSFQIVAGMAGGVLSGAHMQNLRNQTAILMSNEIKREAK